MKKKVLLGAFLCAFLSMFSAQILYAQKTLNPNLPICILPASAPMSPASAAVTRCPPPDPTPTPTPIPTPTPVVGSIGSKYTVLTVTYAPPGSASTVTYSNSTMLGTSLSLSNSFTSATSQSVSVGGGFSIFGIKIGGSGSSTTQYSQEADTSSSIAVNQTTTLSTTIPGPASSALGLSHDVDLIWIWLNPVLNFTINSSSSITWTGFSFDLRDPVGDMDVIAIPVAFLNGHQAMPANIADVLARRWAPRIVCTSADPNCGTDGTEDPGLNASDFAAILTADPFSNPGYVVNIPAGSTCTADGRFCRTTNQDLLYSPPPAGGQPITQTFSMVHQSTATQGQGATDTRQVGFSTDLNVSGGFFIFTFNADLKNSSTLTSMNKWSSLSTQQVGQTASVTVKGPATADNYTGPVEFEVFQDNIYGTFMFGFIPAPTFNLFASPASQSVIQGACTNYTASVSALISGFSSTVALSVTGLPANATASFSPLSITGAGSSTLTVCTTSSTPVASSLLTITGIHGIEIHTTTAGLTVTPPPDFTFGATPSSQSVVAGGNASYTVSTSALNGFSGNVALSVLSGLPLGASAIFTPPSITGTGSSTLSITTSTTTPLGSYVISIAGVRGSLSKSTSITLTVNSSSPGNFTLSATPGSQTVNAGDSAFYTVATSVLNGFNGTVTLTASGPGGDIFVDLSPASITGAGSASLAITTSGTTPAGTYFVSITGSSGSLSHSTGVTITVNSNCLGQGICPIQ